MEMRPINLVTATPIDCEPPSPTAFASVAALALLIMVVPFLGARLLGHLLLRDLHAVGRCVRAMAEEIDVAWRSC